ncbi:ferredoxin [Pontitalea aquivivens]|uniref:ferredoxin n=1 Tax=Pontitalea aquivivens TaxID=3388663 RepID=UPI003970E61D
MTLATLEGAAGDERLFVSGLVALGPEDGLPAKFAALALLSPDEPGFWDHVTASPEFADGAADPLDRWSSRVIRALALGLDGMAVFPFGGPPWHPFQHWALRSGRAWASPVRFLVHDRMGLMASYRGAIALPGPISLPTPAAAAPCVGCTAPCVAACPPGALTGAGYDLPACHAFLDRPEGENCLNAGCLVRRACPLSQTYGRLARQSAWHMRQFHK